MTRPDRKMANLLEQHTAAHGRWNGAANGSPAQSTAYVEKQRIRAEIEMLRKSPSKARSAAARANIHSTLHPRRPRSVPDRKKDKRLASADLRDRMRGRR